MKRTFDIALSGLALFALWPFLLVVAGLLRVTHGKPVIFRQTRVGRHGVHFELYKFRTMRNASGLALTAGADPRIHKIGRVLRKTKIDELPQLWNVLIGEMSVVGPRPEVSEFVEYWPADQRKTILTVRPGITDPASIRFRHESDLLANYDDPRAAYIEKILPEKCNLYVDYVEHQSLRTDALLVLQTVRAILKN